MWCKMNTRKLHVNGALLDFVTEDDRKFHELVIHLMDLLRFQTFNCHSVCRALAVCIPKLTVITGGYRGLRQVEEQERAFRITIASHSWLKTPDGAFIDPYPVGVITYAPFLIPNVGESVYLTFGSGLYHKDCPGHRFKKKDKKVKYEVRKLVRFWRRKMRQGFK